MTYKTIHSEQQEHYWDNSIAPVLTVEPGTTVCVEGIDASDGQLTASSTVEDVASMDLSRVDPVSGPVYVDGAEPGDALKVVIREIVPAGWAWTAVIPNFGLLAEEFPDPALHMWSLDKAFSPATAFGGMAKVPLKPCCGTIGVAPAEPGQHSTIPPRAVGGNMDIRDIGLDVELYLPVQVEGALFSLGDTHAAQGDGEVCGTAIEAPTAVTVDIDLVKGQNLPSPRFTTSTPVTRHLDASGYEVTTGIESDLMQAAKSAVRYMIDQLDKNYGMNAVEAYMLCSVCADLRISELVDKPNWVVSCYLPRQVFE